MEKAIKVSSEELQIKEDIMTKVTELRLLIEIRDRTERISKNLEMNLKKNGMGGSEDASR